MGSWNAAFHTSKLLIIMFHYVIVNVSTVTTALPLTHCSVCSVSHNPPHEYVISCPTNRYTILPTTNLVHIVLVY